MIRNQAKRFGGMTPKNVPGAWDTRSSRPTAGLAVMAQLAARPEVAMIFTDMAMPGGMTGYELAQAAWP